VVSVWRRRLEEKNVDQPSLARGREEESVDSPSFEGTKLGRDISLQSILQNLETRSGDSTVVLHRCKIRWKKNVEVSDEF